MGLHVESLSKSPHLCSLHFSESDFDRSSLMRTRLQESAIPFPNILEKYIENTKKDEILSMPSTSVNISLSESTHNNDLISSALKDNETEPMETSHHVSDEIPTEISFRTSVSNDELESTVIQTCHRKGASDDNEITLKRNKQCSTFDHTNQRLEDTPRKKFLRQALVNQKKFYQMQVRTLKQKNKRQAKRIAHLNVILKELKQKRFLTDEYADLLKTIDLVSSSSYERQSVCFS
ncbi:PREDICTED: uncharacterized protein LOC105567497 isoform X2 [Vollenhovia emeryi]|uniref:uncharacterized protein LOC105567497 isoform X2 n=1 Tax=Vollenhovia emeryi TaxID=411798 RepID=UPI0005F48F22|nr:PREDICTED: uncharacterized protein LOC105567497 isoform X2 [Vollenhovia emeryi]